MSLTEYTLVLVYSLEWSGLNGRIPIKASEPEYIPRFMDAAYLKACSFHTVKCKVVASVDHVYGASDDLAQTSFHQNALF